MREFFQLMVAQAFYLTVLTWKVRAVANGNVFAALISEVITATFVFFIVHKIATCKQTVTNWAGYVIGGSIGTVFGLWL